MMSCTPGSSQCGTPQDGDGRPKRFVLAPPQREARWRKYTGSRSWQLMSSSIVSNDTGDRSARN